MVDPQTLKFLELLSNPSYVSLFFVFMIWQLVWKGVALWKSSRNNQKRWFIVLLVINTLGILEIIYIFYFSRNIKGANEKNNLR